MLFAVIATAQNEASVSGRVLDADTGQPLPFGTVTVSRQSDGVTVTGSLTDEAGRFRISGLAEGNYIINSSFLGYVSVDTPLLVGDKNDFYDIGEIELGQASDLLEEVIVSAQRQILEASLDRRIYRLEDNFAQSTGSLLDAMRGLPGVTVDQEGRVLLRGSDRVAILIDGKQSSLT